jgi:hypothetical protein
MAKNMPLPNNCFLLKNYKKRKSRDFKIQLKRKLRPLKIFAFKISSQKNAPQKR